MIFHCKAKAISRAAGRSAVGAAAYRAGERLVDERTGEIHDYTKKRGVLYKEVVVPEGSPQLRRSDVWNMAEAAEKRKDAKIAREWELGLPIELNAAERRELARDFAKALVERYSVIVDIAIHAPGRGGDIRNHHAHLLTTTRSYGPEGLGEKTRVLDSPKTSGKEVDAVRELWERCCNLALSRAGSRVRADRRTLKARGIVRSPTRHLGPAATAMERRGVATFVGDENRTALGQSVAAEEHYALQKADAGIEAAKGRFAERKAEKERQKIRAQQEREALLRERKPEAQPWRTSHSTSSSQNNFSRPVDDEQACRERRNRGMGR